MLTPRRQISTGAGADSLSLDEICQILAPYAQKTLLLAVSGGPDSVAMMGMAALWRDHVRHAGHIRVATVDHGLRAESQGEAEQVARFFDEGGYVSPGIKYGWRNVLATCDHVVTSLFSLRKRRCFHLSS